MSTRGTAFYAVDEAAAASAHLMSRSRVTCTSPSTVTIPPQLYDPQKKQGRETTLQIQKRWRGLRREVRGAALEQLPLPRTEMLLGPAPAKLHDVLLVLDADCVGHGR